MQMSVCADRCLHNVTAGEVDCIFEWVWEYTCERAFCPRVTVHAGVETLLHVCGCVCTSVSMSVGECIKK